tara:strand:- start:569 stop:760 length:192 start_codon:yes stop_codon:yes gene_type:complete
MGKRKAAPAPPPAKTKAEVRQEKEDVKLDKQIAAREDARKRAKQGRMSLISGDERGIYSNTLG